METVIETIKEERSKISLFQDSLAASWAEIALNENNDELAVSDYLTNLTFKRI